MTEAKHTPGPWRECRNGDCTCGVVWSIPGDFPVCTVSNETGRNLQTVAVAHEHMADAPDMIYATLDREHVVANARLIAAAPDMLNALELAEQAEIETDGDWRMTLTERAQEARRAVIAKATGVE